MKRAEIVVLNDMHPSDVPGAATIALIHAKFLSEEFAVAFWHTSTKRVVPNMDEELTVRSFYRSKKLDNLIQRGMTTRLFFEFFPSLLALKIVFRLLCYRPKIVWVNQIGSRIPRTIVFFLHLTGIRTIQTFHDFGVVSPRKLFPSNLTSQGSAILSKNKVINAIYTLRRRYLISLTRQNIVNICISRMQAEILQQLGLGKIEIIPNGINGCTCDLDPASSQKNRTVLFAGRITGKGFEATCKLVSNNPNWTLLAAGSSELEKLGLLFLSEQQFKYLGLLEPKALFQEVHRVDFVSVLSECFDVYPTIALEAFMHDSNVISSPTTGVADLILETKHGLVLENSIENLNLDDLRTECQTNNPFPKEKISVNRSGELHSSLFFSALSPAPVHLLDSERN
jgi:glycosyltransferase involved in cell wall biosynthesis